MSQSPAMSDDSDFYGDQAEVEVQVSPKPTSPPGGDVDMDQSPPASPSRTAAVASAAAAAATATATAPARLPIKRKLSPVTADASGVSVSAKRHKLTITPQQYYSTAVARTAGLPAEVWQHTFLYLTPDSLMSCMRVNKQFNQYLTSVTSAMSVRLPPRRTALKLMDGEAIWASARKLFAPHLPRPIAGLSEMQMFQLLAGKYCQLCGNDSNARIKAKSPFEAGPGPDGVRIIWSFGARMCGQCFDAASLKDTDILQSTAAPLRAGLPYAFRTHDLHYIPATTLQSNPAWQPKGPLAKVHYYKHVDELQKEYEDAKEFGDAAAEEWIKGLPLNGKQQMADAARWERWEALHPVGAHPATTLREYFRQFPALVAPVSQQVLPAAPTAAPTPSSAAANVSTLPVLSSQQMKYPLPAKVVAAHQAPPPTSPTAQIGLQNRTSPQQGLPQTIHQLNAAWPPAPAYRTPRDPREVEEARALRKAEIERRCYEEFSPPLLPNVLQHMESFRNAMHIVHPLTDHAWGLLKSRLYVQRDAAEFIEYQKAEHFRAMQASVPDLSYGNNYSKTATDAADKIWEQQQVPVRKKLGKLAEDFIRVKWNHARNLSRETAPAFAVEVLLYARNKYVESNTWSNQERKDEPRDASDPAFISLENMRWLFDNKVKNHTEKHCRELFRCAECEGVKKGYAFEGMMQHFGAKHTTDFSQGNIVVHWQTADWPDVPPFVPTMGQADPTLPGEQHAFALPATVAQKMPSTSKAFPPDTDAGVGYTSQPTNPSPAQIEQLFASLNAPSQAVTSGPVNSIQNHDHNGQRQATQTHGARAQEAGNVDQDQHGTIANVVKDIWDGTGGVTGMVESVRVQIVLDHVMRAFKSRYNMAPTLDVFVEALTNNPLMNAYPLACKTCVESSLGSTAYKPYHQRLADNEKYNFSSLVAHFKAVHMAGQDASYTDWKKDMIEMADEIQIKSLLSAVGMDDEKLAIVGAAFPDMFPNPLPRIGKIVSRDTSSLNNSLGRFNKFNKKDKKKKAHQNRPGHETQEDAEQSDLPEAGDDEYDPRRPAFIATGDGGLKFESRRRRSQGRATDDNHSLVPALDPAVLTPEALAALSKIAPALNLNPAAITAAVTGSSGNHGGSSANNAAFRANQHAGYHPEDPAAGNRKSTHQSYKEKRTSKGRPRKSGAGASGAEEATEPEEDYTQIIRTAPANNDSTSLAQHPGRVAALPTQYADRTGSGSMQAEGTGYGRVPLDQHGRPIPANPYGYVPREPVEYLDSHGRPLHYAPPPQDLPEIREVRYVDRYGREEVRHVDQYGLPVQVIRIMEEPVHHNNQIYDYPPQPHGYPAPSGHRYPGPPDHGYAGPPSHGYAGLPNHGYTETPVHGYSVPFEYGYARPGEQLQDVHRAPSQYHDYGRPYPGPPAPY